jgi:hypothetical protein
MLALLWRTDRLRRIVITAVWGLLSVIAGAGGSLGAAAGLRAARIEQQPWYAHPDPFFVLVAASGLLTAWVLLTGARLVPERWRPLWSSASVWVLALPGWIAIAILTNRTAPQTAFLFTLPLLAASVPIALPFGRPFSVVAGGVLSLLTVAALWWPGLGLLLRFVVPMFGWLPVVTPVWLYPALAIAIGVMSLPPMLALVTASSAAWARRAHAVAGAVLLGIGIVTAVVSIRADAYTPDRPLRRSVRYVQDSASNHAWWEIASNEPGVDVSAGGPRPTSWRATREAFAAAVPVPPLSWPFRSWVEAAPEVPTAPIALTVASRPDGPGRTRWSLAIVPHEALAVRVTLPRGVAPLDSTWRGAVTSGAWTATYVAVPADGVTLELTMPEMKGGLDAAVVAVTDHLPGAAPGDRLPPWLDTTRTAWTARSWYVISTRDVLSRGGSSTATPSAPQAPSR